jgi:gamma-resorcylate decarboxylase
MKNKIALEEHFATKTTVQDSAGFVPEQYWTELKHRLLDIHETRLFQMDEHGIEHAVLSLNAPAVQAIASPAQAIEVARQANETLALEISRRRDRFSGFAALPMQDPQAACAELQRCLTEYQFVGALINGFSQIGEPTNVVYLDDARYEPFWALLAASGKPLYLHPRNPIGAWTQLYEGHPWLLGPTWAFGNETAVHALRLMASGVFDRHPSLKVIIGHMGEGLPVSLWRCDHRNAWVKAPKGYPATQGFGDTFRKHFWITTSGNFRTQALTHAISELGSSRIMFSADWPFENMDHAAQWFDQCAISPADLLQIGRQNAIDLLGLNL